MVTLTKPLKTLVNGLIDLIYPAYCLHCYKNLNNHTIKYLCPECISQIKRIGLTDICLKCGLYLGPHTGVIPPRRDCSDCRTRQLSFKRVIAFGRYEGILQELILQYKYGREKLLAHILGDWLVECLREHPTILKEVNLIAPVPISRKKLKQRGFNQSELLAQRISGLCRIPLSVGNLMRIKDAPAQASLSKSERLRNPKDAFSVKRPDEFKDKTILLIDDVLTTGATASEISRILRKNGARGVYVLVLGR